MPPHSSHDDRPYPSHDDRKGRHYYTPASQADASVYSSDDPCGRHVVGAAIMGWGRPSWGKGGHHAHDIASSTKT